MNTVSPEQLKAKKNCLLVFRNKKLNDFNFAESIIQGFATGGYYFEKVSFVAFDRSEEIVHALVSAKTDYENAVILCPYEMAGMLKSFISHQYCSQFDNNGALVTDKESVFILYSDAKNALNIEDIIKALNDKYGVKYERAYIRTIGASSDKINSAISSVKNCAGDVQFNVTEKFGDCRIELVYSDKTPKTVFDNVLRVLVNKLNDNIYSLEDSSIAQRLFELLKLRRMKISVAESFTGGGIGKRLVDISGISQVYFEGLNTYSNEAKQKRLGVKEETLFRYGAVSEQTAREMASGLIESGDCDISIATTGIAGPQSDNTRKPVGLCYIAVGTKEDVFVYKFNLSGDRKCITETAINFALFLAYKALK